MWRTLCALCMLAQAGAAPGDAVRIAGRDLTVEMSAASGSIRSFGSVRSGMTLTPPSGVGDGFRLILRDRHGSIRIIRAGSQSSPRWQTDGNRAIASWSGPLRDEGGGVHPIGVRVSYAILRPDPPDEEFRIQLYLDNHSDATVLEVWLPSIGGLAALGGDVVGSNPAIRRPLRLPFGDWAPHYPGAIPMAFVDIGGPKGLYYAAYEKTARIKLLRVAENDGDIAARITHLPFLKPGGSFASCASVFRFHDGGYAAAGRIYRKWFLRTFGMKDPRKDWLRRQSFFQMTMVMLPEGNINYRYRDIPRLARDAKKYGVTAIQIAGWQRGGHDNGYPYYEPDPRLGTWDDLRRAIVECHRMGVRVYFFINLQPAMMDIDWYRTELRAYEAKSETGDPFWIAGWGMGTLASRIGLTTPLMAFLDPAFPRYADELLAYYRKLASIGADGVHIDKMYPQGVNANPHAPLPADTSTWEGAVRFLARMDRECRAINPNWRVSHECSWDRVLPIGTATWWAGNMTAVKGVFHETAETVGLYQPYDYIGVNNAVREGWVVMVAPYQFQRSMDEPTWRGLARYIRDVKRIRDRLSNAVFLGERLPNEAVKLQTSGGSALWSVFRDPASGGRVCVVTNNGDDRSTCVFSAFTGSRAGAVRIHTPGREPLALALPATVDIAPERLVFIEELPATYPTPNRHDLRLPPRRAASPAPRRPFANATFENGTLEGWQADDNWTVDDNSAGGWYSGWEGRKFAWSGKGGEPRTGKLRSPVFRLDAEGVQVSVAGWSDIEGRTPDRWNYVTLNLENGQELDRVYTPNTTQFTPLVLLGTGHRGERVYIEAVDDGTAEVYSMICIDDVRLWDPPKAEDRPLRSIPGAIVLENARYRLEIGRANGTIARIRDKASGEEIIREPRLSDNWRFSLPVRDAVVPPERVGASATGRHVPEGWRNHEGNYIAGRLQRLTSWERTADGVVLRWAGPLAADDGVRHPVSVTMRVRLTDDGVRFETKIANKSPFEIGEVYAPILGGLQGLGDHAALRANTELVMPQNGGFAMSRPFHTFVGQTAFGIFGPERFAVYPSALDAPWAALRLRHGRRMLYFAAHDPVARLKALHLEMVPGVAGARGSGNWPRADELGGRPVGVRMAWMHMVYQPAGKAFEASPVILRVMNGEPSEAARAYHEWFAAVRLGPPASQPEPSRLVPRMPFARLASIADEAVAAGQKALTLADWKIGAPDDGAPLLEPDPALGGWEGLRQAAAECRKRGVRLVLQAQVNPVSLRSDVFRRQLRGFLCMDRWGIPQTVMGWAKPRCTAEALAGGERRGYVNTGHSGFRKWFVKAVEKVAAAGVSGLHVQGFFPSILDFNATAGMTPDRSIWEGSLRTLQEALAAARRHTPDFRIAVDERRDRTVE